MPLRGATDAAPPHPPRGCRPPHAVAARCRRPSLSHPSRARRRLPPPASTVPTGTAAAPRRAASRGRAEARRLAWRAGAGGLPVSGGATPGTPGVHGGGRGLQMLCRTGHQERPPRQAPAGVSAAVRGGRGQLAVRRGRVGRAPVPRPARRASTCWPCRFGGSNPRGRVERVAMRWGPSSCTYGGGRGGSRSGVPRSVSSHPCRQTSTFCFLSF